jgi:hypothetical protein
MFGPSMRTAVLALVLAARAATLSAQSADSLPFVPGALRDLMGPAPAVTAAEADLARARARRGAAGPAGDWFVSSGVSEAPNADLSQGNIRLELGHDILPSGRQAAEREVADAASARATAVLLATSRRVDAARIRAVSRAVGWDLVRRRRASQDTLLALAEDALRARFGAGQARYLDVLRLRTERLRVAAGIAAAAAQAQAGRATLTALLAPGDTARLRATLATLDSGTQDWPGPLPDVPSADVLAAGHPALTVAQADVAKAEAERTLARSARRAQGSAFAGIQRVGQATGGPALGPTLGVTFYLPFLSSGTTRRIVQAGDTAVVAAESRAVAARAEVTAGLAAATARYAGARDQVATFDAALLRGARSEREVALSGYRAGALSLLELLDFERALAEAEIGRLESLLTAADAWADLLDVQAGVPSNASPE